jgi:phage antirepressor YoqD-like protein
LSQNFIENVDYIKLGNNVDGKTMSQKIGLSVNYMLSVSCLEYFIVRKEREVFNIYRECRKKLQVNQIPTSFAEALQLAANLEKEKEILRIQAIQDKPKVEFFDAAMSSNSAFPIGEIAKILGYKGVGRNKLCAVLRENNILMKNNVPYQSHISSGHFQVVESIFEKSNGMKVVHRKTLVLQKGVNYIMKKLNNLGYEKIIN